MSSRISSSTRTSCSIGWRTIRQPTIAAISGVALGGGAELALCCDYRIMDADARIGFPEILLGTVPGSGGLSRLPRLVNPSRAIGLFLDGHPISAEHALEIGLANEVTMSRGLASSGRSSELAPGPRAQPSQHQAIKRSVLQTSRDEMAREVDGSLDVSRAIFATDDMREGVSAFLEKRPPQFRHR